MFIHEFIKFFSALTPGDRNSLRRWLLPDQDGTNSVVERFIERVGFNPWNDDSFGNHIHSYLNNDPSDHDNLHLAYGRLENLAKQDFLCREAEIASIEEDINSVLLELACNGSRLGELYRRLHTMKGIQSYPIDELCRLEEATCAVGRNNFT